MNLLKIGFAFLLVIVIILVYLLVGFYNYWLSPIEFDTILFNDIQFQTGDMLFFKNYKSLSVPLTHTIFSHVGIVIIINKIPFVLEMVTPFAYITPLKHKLMENDGIVYFYKKIMSPINDANLTKLYNFLEKSENLTYRTRPQNINYNMLEQTTVCSEFVYHCLINIGILDKSKYDNTQLLDFLSLLTQASDSYQYDKVKKISFFIIDHQYKFTELIDIAINGIAVKEEKDKILNMPIYKGIWRREIQKITLK